MLIIPHTPQATFPWVLMRRVGSLAKRRFTLVASCFLVFGLVLLIHSEHSRRSQQGPQADCIGSESAIVERKEEYVQEFVKRLSGEARTEDSTDKVQSLLQLFGKAPSQASFSLASTIG